MMIESYVNSGIILPFLYPLCSENAGPLFFPVLVVTGKNAFGPGVLLVSTDEYIILDYLFSLMNHSQS